MNLKTSFILIMIFTSPLLRGQENSGSSNTYKSLYKTKIDLTMGTENWAENMASVVFDETIQEDEKTTEFYISKQDNDFLVNIEIPLRGDNESQSEAIKKCETLKKTCRSEKCVASTLIEILGEGDRDVFIKYERKLLSVQIYYTYQDCR